MMLVTMLLSWDVRAGKDWIIPVDRIACRVEAKGMEGSFKSFLNLSN